MARHQDEIMISLAERRRMRGVLDVADTARSADDVLSGILADGAEAGSGRRTTYRPHRIPGDRGMLVWFPPGIGPASNSVDRIGRRFGDYAEAMVDGHAGNPPDGSPA